MTWGYAATLAERTHCAKGHEYTPENTVPRGDGHGRKCRTCANDRRRALAAKRKGWRPSSTVDGLNRQKVPVFPLEKILSDAGEERFQARLHISEQRLWWRARRSRWISVARADEYSAFLGVPAAYLWGEYWTTEDPRALYRDRLTAALRAQLEGVGL